MFSYLLTGKFISYMVLVSTDIDIQKIWVQITQIFLFNLSICSSALLVLFLKASSVHFGSAAASINY